MPASKGCSGPGRNHEARTRLQYHRHRLVRRIRLGLHRWHGWTQGSHQHLAQVADPPHAHTLLLHASQHHPHHPARHNRQARRTRCTRRTGCRSSNRRTWAQRRIRLRHSRRRSPKPRRRCNRGDPEGMAEAHEEVHAWREGEVRRTASCPVGVRSLRTVEAVHDVRVPCTPKKFRLSQQPG